jgi:hypothetical protein
VRFTGREGKMDRQAIGVHDRVNLAGQAPHASDPYLGDCCPRYRFRAGARARSSAPPHHDRRPANP